jgi:hypothetical protein
LVGRPVDSYWRAERLLPLTSAHSRAGSQIKPRQMHLDNACDHDCACGSLRIDGVQLPHCMECRLLTLVCQQTKRLSDVDAAQLPHQRCPDCPLRPVNPRVSCIPPTHRCNVFVFPSGLLIRFDSTRLDRNVLDMSQSLWLDTLNKPIRMATKVRV